MLHGLLAEHGNRPDDVVDFLLSLDLLRVYDDELALDPTGGDGIARACLPLRRRLFPFYFSFFLFLFSFFFLLFLFIVIVRTTATPPSPPTSTLDCFALSQS